MRASRCTSCRKVRIKGSGLNTEARRPIRLFDGIIRHRVPWIREADRAEFLKAGRDSVVVEQMTGTNEPSARWGRGVSLSGERGRLTAR